MKGKLKVLLPVLLGQLGKVKGLKRIVKIKIENKMVTNVDSDYLREEVMNECTESKAI